MRIPWKCSQPKVNSHCLCADFYLSWNKSNYLPIVLSNYVFIYFTVITQNLKIWQCIYHHIIFLYLKNDEDLNSIDLEHYWADQCVVSAFSVQSSDHGDQPAAKTMFWPSPEWLLVGYVVSSIRWFHLLLLPPPGKWLWDVETNQGISPERMWSGFFFK